jgi:hypothetical protein
VDSGREARKKRYWQVDPSIFKPGPKDRRVRRYLVEPGKSLGKFAFFGLLFTYPLYMVILGVVFGAVIFWGSFLGSVALMGFLIWKFGYAGHFAAWNPSLRRQLIGLSGGAVMAAGFLLGLTTFLGHLSFGLWLVPLIVGLLVFALLVALWRVRL